MSSGFYDKHICVRCHSIKTTCILDSFFHIWLWRLLSMTIPIVPWTRNEWHTALSRGSCLYIFIRPVYTSTTKIILLCECIASATRNRISFASSSLWRFCITSKQLPTFLNASNLNIQITYRSIYYHFHSYLLSFVLFSARFTVYTAYRGVASWRIDCVYQRFTRVATARAANFLIYPSLSFPITLHLRFGSTSFFVSISNYYDNAIIP